MTDHQNYALLALFENPQTWVPFRTIADMVGLKPAGGLASILHCLEKNSYVASLSEQGKNTTWRITEAGAEYVRNNLAGKVKQPAAENPVNLKTLTQAIRVLEGRQLATENRVQEWIEELEELIGNFQDLENKFKALDRHAALQDETRALKGRIDHLSSELRKTDEFTRTHLHHSAVQQMVADIKKGGGKKINFTIE